jgi:hypothetical protein
MTFPTTAIMQPMAALLHSEGLVDGDDHKTRLSTKGLSLSFVVISHVDVGRSITHEFFQKQHLSIPSLLAKIKEEARIWCAAGAKLLAEIMSVI